MTKLTIQSRGQYRNKKGNLVFRYAVKGKEADLEKYRDAQGEFLVEDSTTGDPLYFSSRFVGKSCDLIVTDEGKIYADMSELEQQASLVAQFGGNLGQAMADEMARKLTGRSASPSKGSVKENDDDDSSEPLDGEKAKPAVRKVRRS